MSALYNLEPPPTAKLLLQTTSGDILLELFGKQAPLATRNFLQLCLDGYYNGTIFHRLVPGFIIQGGDPTGTGEGGEAIYDGGLFADEFHSRLKFNRRGLLGMANGGTKDDNGSQFFLTLGKTDELNRKHTMFGRVEGDTIYNLMKMGDAELDDAAGIERPLYPIKITGAEILVNPYNDMVARTVKPRALVEDKVQKKKPKKKAGKALLSFGGEDGDEPEEPVLKKAKYNTKLVSAAPGTEVINHQGPKTSNKPARARKRSSVTPPPPPAPKLNMHPETQLPLPNEGSSRSSSMSPEPTGVSKVSSLLEQTNAQIAELKASMKRRVPTAAPETSRKKSTLEQMIPETSIRGRKRKHGNKEGDTRAVAMLDAFREKLAQAPPAEIKLTNLVDTIQGDLSEPNETENREDDEEAVLCDLHFIANCQSCKSWDKQEDGDADAADEDDGAWMSHSLSFEKDRLGKDLNWKKRNEEELVVIDPREKANQIKEEHRQKKQGKSVGSRAWDRDRGREPRPSKS